MTTRSRELQDIAGEAAAKVLIAAVALLTAPRSTAAGVPADAATLLDGAAKRFDLQREGTAPIQLRARVVATDAKGDAIEGNYHLVWVSPTAWLEEIAFPAFWEVSGQSGKRSWRKRKLQFTPEPFHWLRKTVHFARRLEREPVWTADPVARRRVRGAERTCVKVRSNDSSWRQWCFDPGSGDVVREDAETVADRGIVVDYDDWREAEGKRFPAKISYSVEKHKRIELSVTEFSKAPEIDPARFEPPQGAEEDPVCDALQPPQAPPGAESEAPRSSDGRTLRGVATLEFFVAADGSVRRIQIASSTSPQFGRAFAEQLSRMKFTPALCDGRPVQMYFTLRKSVR